MPDPTQLALYFAAALVLAATPGPGIFYVAARTLAGGRAEGVASSFGTGLGGMAHVLAGSLGVSAVVLASAELFTALKLIGAAYLIWLGLRTFQSARRDAATGLKGGSAAPPIGPRRAFREGVLVEALNRRQQPSSSPSFRSSWPRRKATSRCNSWCLASSRLRSTTLADIVVAFAASGIREGAAARPALIRRLREGSGAAMMALGIGLAFASALRTDRWAALL